MLSKVEKCAGCLLETLKVTQPTLSHHMSVLVKSGMVNARKEGKWQYYSINCEKFSEFKEFISSITCCENSASSDCCESDYHANYNRKKILLILENNYDQYFSKIFKCMGSFMHGNWPCFWGFISVNTIFFRNTVYSRNIHSYCRSDLDYDHIL